MAPSVPNSGGPRRPLPGDSDDRGDGDDKLALLRPHVEAPPPRKPQPREPRGPLKRPRGPAAFNLPPVLKAALVAMILVELAMSVAPHGVQSWLFFTLGYIPFLNGEFYLRSMPGLVLHAFLHGGWGHLIMNLLWLVIGGKVICERLTQGKFVVFFAATAVGGALASTVINWGEDMVLMGASGVVFGIMGAGAWFWVGHKGDSARERLNKIAIYAIIMMALNLAYAFVLSEGGDKVAWEAHAGGFFTGLALFPFLTRRPRGRPGGDLFNGGGGAKA